MDTGNLFFILGCVEKTMSGVISPSIISCVNAHRMLITWIHFFWKEIVWLYLNKPENIIIIAGTNGKTSVLKYIWHI